MANQTECTICTKAKQGGYGEIKCSFYGRKPQFDDTPCPHYSKNETSGITECECQSDSSNARCPECGPEVSQQSSTCSTCGFPMKDDENGNTITSPNNGDTSTDGLNGTLRCPDCGLEVPQTSSTCPNCGCPLKEQENENNITPQKDCGTDTGVLNEVSWCPQCGQKVPQMSNFCPKCGCSFKEYVNYNGDTRATPSSRPHKKNGNTKFTSKRSIIVVAIIVLIAVIILICSIGGSHQNKKNLCGTWLYTGGRYASVTFEEDGTFHTGGFLDSKGRYEINGKEINIYYSHGTSTTLKLADDNNLYAPDGSHYVKISQEEQDKLNRVNEELFKIQEANRALQYMYEYNARYNNHLF